MHGGTEQNYIRNSKVVAWSALDIASVLIECLRERVREKRNKMCGKEYIYTEEVRGDVEK